MSTGDANNLLGTVITFVIFEGIDIVRDDGINMRFIDTLNDNKGREVKQRFTQKRNFLKL